MNLEQLQRNSWNNDTLNRTVYEITIYTMGNSFIEVISYDQIKEKFSKSGYLTSPYISGRRAESITTEKEKEENKKSSMRRSINNFRRLVLSNLDGQQFLFLTLTFAENLIDLDEAYLKLKIFLSQLRKKYSLKYLGVYEFQKRGAIHFHIFIFNLDYIKPKDLKKWKHGFYKIKMVVPKDHQKVSNYLTKYFSKSFETKTFGRKRYFASSNLKRPLKSYITNETFRQLDLSNYLLYNEYTADLKTDGKINYKQYKKYEQ